MQQTVFDIFSDVTTPRHHIEFMSQLARLVVAFLVGLTIAAVHRRTTTERPPSASFLAMLVLYCIFTAILMMVVGNDLAKAFSLAGALTVVRFRSVVDESRDAAFVILTVITGMAVGTGHLKLACAGIAVGTVAAFVCRHLPGGDTTSWRLTLRMQVGPESDAVHAETFPRYFERWMLTHSATAKKGQTLDVRYTVTLRHDVAPLDALRGLQPLPWVKSVKLDRE